MKYSYLIFVVVALSTWHSIESNQECSLYSTCSVTGDCMGCGYPLICTFLGFSKLCFPATTTRI